MFMISFTINGSCITNRTITEIWNMFDKLSLIKILKDKKFQMILQGKKSGFKHIGLCYVKGSIEEQDNVCKIEYTIFPEFICVVLFILYIFVCVYKLYIDVMSGFSGALSCGAVISVILMPLPAILIVLESRSQQNVCKERLQYLLSEGWVYWEAPINWHNPRLSYPFGSGSLIANSNNFCQSNV